VVRKKIFVCGSLAQGMIHNQKFFKNAQFISHGYAKGTVYRLEVGYPVFVNVGENFIPGEIFEIEMSDILIALLDEFHGYSTLHPEKSLYIRSEIEVITGDSGSEHVSCYALNPAKLPKTAKKIESGNWQEDFEVNPPLTEKLSGREKEYVRKLGQSSGRDIVPIQLDLYRQLMNLGLIVDKGRRLALSKLGQEVLRFLD